MTGVLQVALDESKTRIVLSRGSDVAEPLWRALGRNIAPGRTQSSDDSTMDVPLERFLSARNIVARALATYECDAILTTDVSELLAREDAERAEVERLLSNRTVPTSIEEARARLAGTRFHRELKPFQLRDLAQLLALPHGANFSVPGAGKTSVAYACYEAERAAGRVERLLVVAPLSAFDAWQTEALRCFDPAPVVKRIEGRLPRRAEVLLVNYQRLSARYDAIAAWVGEASCQVILDEAHRMKRGRSGDWGSTCLDLAHLAARRDILTGTPAPQHPKDFVALLDYLWPHQAARILPVAATRPDPPSSVMVDVSRRLAPFFARTKKDELGLRPPILRVELVDPHPLQTEIYAALRTKMRYAVDATASDKAMFGRMGEVVMYLLEAATNPALLSTAIANRNSDPVRWPPLAIPEDSSLAERILAYPRYEVPRKFEKLAALVADNAAENRKTLVWSNFVTNLETLRAHILAPYQPALIHGGIPSSANSEEEGTREAELQRFRTDPDCAVLLANPAAMSEGVSLHETCHDAVYVDRTFNAGQYLQSIDRIHRLGLPDDVDTRITFLVSMGTVDEAVDDRVRVKAERLAQMLSDPNLATMALPDDEAYGEWIDPDDLDALFRHLRDG